MPKNKFQDVVFTIIMATIMVYGMVVYNIALNTGTVNGTTFIAALHELPIMVPVAFILEFFIVGRLARLLAFTVMKPTDRPQFITYAISICICCIMCPVMTTKEAMEGVSAKKRAIQSVVCGILIGFICGFIGAGGGMMMLLILTSVLGYELKTAVGTSVFIMTFTALTGAVSHFAIGGIPDITVWILCIVFTLIWARIAAIFANKATPETLNRATGVILVILGIVVMLFSYLG